MTGWFSPRRDFSNQTKEGLYASLQSITRYHSGVTHSISRSSQPTDALINNTLSLPPDLNKAMIVDEHVTQDIAELRGQLWPFILGVVAFDLALQIYFYGVYVLQTREQ